MRTQQRWIALTGRAGTGRGRGHGRGMVTRFGEGVSPKDPHYFWIILKTLFEKVMRTTGLEIA